MYESMSREYDALKAWHKDVPEWPVAMDRCRNLWGMNEIIKSLNDENAYMSWIYDVPDEATLEDIMYIACNPDLFADCVKKFILLFRRYVKDGLYIGRELYFID